MLLSYASPNAVWGRGKAKYPTITKLIGHYEYRELENSELWLEKDKGYRTQKKDPGKKFMSAVRQEVWDLNLTK